MLTVNQCAVMDLKVQLINGMMTGDKPSMQVGSSDLKYCSALEEKGNERMAKSIIWALNDILDY